MPGAPEDGGEVLEDVGTDVSDWDYKGYVLGHYFEVDGTVATCKACGCVVEAEKPDDWNRLYMRKGPPLCGRPAYLRPDSKVRPGNCTFMAKTKEGEHAWGEPAANGYRRCSRCGASRDEYSLIGSIKCPGKRMPKASLFSPELMETLERIQREMKPTYWDNLPPAIQVSDEIFSDPELAPPIGTARIGDSIIPALASQLAAEPLPAIPSEDYAVKVTAPCYYCSPEPCSCKRREPPDDGC